MLKFILKRLLNLIPTLILVSFLIFFVVSQMPGDPVLSYLGVGSNISHAERERIRELLGLNGSIFEQYIRWVGRVFQGDWGTSISMRRPVTEVISGPIWNTFLLNFVSLIVAAAVSIPIGIKQAVKKYKGFDNTWTVISLLGISVPTFFFALLLIFFVALPFGLPISGMRNTLAGALGYQTIFHNIADVAFHMILPVTVLAFSTFASLSRYVRNAMIDVMNQDYIRTARSKGLKEKIVIYRHGFKNAMIPLVTLLGLYIPSLFSGAVILESVFRWPGIGRGLIQAISTNDPSVIIACMLFSAVMVMAGNLLSDVLYSLVDPRIKV